jgi:hypothetical protein
MLHFEHLELQNAARRGTEQILGANGKNPSEYSTSLKVGSR